MAKMSKRYKALAALVVEGKSYALDDAISLITTNSKAKFVESVDVAVRLGVDAKKSDQQVRGSTVLPAGTGKAVRVAVFCPPGAKADEALAAGARTLPEPIPRLMALSSRVMKALAYRG
jgi:large subunit ribosomal protein L1